MDEAALHALRLLLSKSEVDSRYYYYSIAAQNIVSRRESAIGNAIAVRDATGLSKVNMLVLLLRLLSTLTSPMSSVMVHDTPLLKENFNPR